MKNRIIKDGVTYEYHKGTETEDPFRACALCHLKRIGCREACKLFYTGEWGYFTNADHSQVTSAMSDEDILFITLVGLDKAKDIPTNTGTAADAAKSYIGVLKNLISEHMKEKGDRQ